MWGVLCENILRIFCEANCPNLTLLTIEEKMRYETHIKDSFVSETVYK